MLCLLEWIAHTLHQSRGRSAGIPNRPILAADVEWKGSRFAGNPGTRRTGIGTFGALCWIRFLWSLPSGFTGRPDLGFAWGENAVGKTTATTKYFYIYVFIAVVVV